MDPAILEIIYFVVMGTVLGYIAGLIPGVGNTIMILLSYPIIMDSSLLNMLLYYVALISTSQFSGSVVATVFGVPGESSSMPAVAEGKKLFLRGRGNFAISNAAMGSVLGSLMTVGFVYALLPIAVATIKKYNSTDIQITVLIIASLSMILFFGKSKLLNIFVFAIGTCLALIGRHDIPWFTFLPGIIPYEMFPKLYLGLPLFPVLVSLYAFPLLLTTQKQFKDFKMDRGYKDDSPIKEHLGEFWKNIKSALRGGSLGCLIGFVPHLGTILGSTMSYVWERRIGKRNKTWRPDGDIKSLVAAETANNSSIFTGIMPLLLIGIPTASSEALILAIADANSHVLNYTTTIETNLFHYLVLGFCLTNVLALCLSWPAVKYVNLLTKIKMNTIFWTTMITLMVLVYYIGSLQFDGLYFVVVTLLLLPLGYLLRNTEPMILLIAFILNEKIMSSAVAFYQIHFG
jgi:putative tricarboxylic transport membrane protein